MGGKDQRIKYFEMTFQNVVLTSLQVGGNSGSVPWLQGSFAYGTIAMEYWTIDPKSGKTTSLGKRELIWRTTKDRPLPWLRCSRWAAGPQFEVTRCRNGDLGDAARRHRVDGGGGAAAAHQQRRLTPHPGTPRSSGASFAPAVRLTHTQYLWLLCSA